MRTIHNLIQGSVEWLSHRANYDGASDAPAMLGISAYKTRTELIKERALGTTKDIDDITQRLFDSGHEAEALARPLAEEIIGEDLYPVTMSLEINGLKLSASMDGLTMDESICWEHKRLNKDLDRELDSIPEQYRAQMEQQLLISGAEKCLFMASNGTKESMRFQWYHSDPSMRQRILSGWVQLHEDVKNYQHVEEKPVAVAAPIEALPVVSVQVNGQIAIISNLDKFGSKLMAFIQDINKKPETDEDFANADAAVKTLEKAELALKQAEEQALSQTASVDELRKTVAMYGKQARDTRLMLEKLVKSRKETIRMEIMQEGLTKLSEHAGLLNKRLGAHYITAVADFNGVIKGKKTVSSLRDAVDTELARAKIAANELADKIEINLNTLRDMAGEHSVLFADKAQIVLKANDDLVMLIKSRIADHLAAEEKKVAQIRAEEEAKALAKVKAEQDAIERQRIEDERKAAQQACIANEVSSLMRGTGENKTATGEMLKLDGKKIAITTALPSGAVKRPTDMDIIQAVADVFRVSKGQAIDWMQDVDLYAASVKLEKAA